MKRITKLISLIAALSLLSASFAGCGKDTETAKTDGKNFTLWAVMDGNSLASGIESYADMLLFQEMEKRTGVHIDFIHPIAGSTGSEAFTTMLSASDRPDIMEYNWDSYTGGAQQAIDDEVIVSLNDYLKDYAPNYYDYMEGEKGKANGYLYKKASLTDEGQYYAFNGLNLGETRCFNGLIVRKDKLDEWGLTVPETIDEWTAVFAKAKADGYAKPFTIAGGISAMTGNLAFNTAFGVASNLYVEDGKVVFGPYKDGYKDYIAQMSQWLKDGYLDSGYITNKTAEVEGNMLNHSSVACVGYLSTMSKLTDAGKQNEPSYELVACPQPVANKGETAAMLTGIRETGWVSYAVSANCGNVEAAIEWCDYFYSDEGIILQSFGVEGETFTIEEKDGEKHYVYTDKILDYQAQGAASITETIYRNIFPANHPGMIQHQDYLNSYYPLQSQHDAMELWNKDINEAKKFSLPPLSYTADEARERTDILEIAQTQLEVDLSDIVLGKKPISYYDEAIEKAEKNGYDRIIEITQEAYDRYLAK